MGHGSAFNKVLHRDSTGKSSVDQASEERRAMNGVPRDRQRKLGWGGQSLEIWARDQED